MSEIERLKSFVVGATPGLRFFRCEDCRYDWQEKSRHCQSPSGEACPFCNGWVQPHRFESHPEYPKDKSGNLIEETK